MPVMEIRSRNRKAMNSKQLSFLRQPLAATCFAATMSLCGCVTNTNQGVDFSSEFLGRFLVTEVSGDSGVRGRTLEIASPAAGQLVISIVGGRSFDLYDCRSRVANESNMLGNDSSQDSVHEVVCEDSEEWTWVLSYGKPELIEEAGLFNRILPGVHTVHSHSGYILHRGYPNRLPHVYALDPVR